MERSQKEKELWWKKYSEYLHSDTWANIRTDLFLSRGKFCEICNSSQNLQIHHLTYKNVFHEEPEDLLILCKLCHEAQHGIGKKKKLKSQVKKVKWSKHQNKKYKLSPRRRKQLGI